MPCHRGGPPLILTLPPEGGTGADPGAAHPSAGSAQRAFGAAAEAAVLAAAPPLGPL